MAAEITLRNLHAFFWLARLRKFHLVADKLHTTQPAISARIGKLEEELGVRLFTRGHRTVQLTPEGQEALRLSEAVLDAADQLVDRFAVTKQPSGIAHIGVVDSIARTWLPSLLGQIQAEHASIALEITTDSTINLHRLLSDGKLDIAISMLRYEARDFANAELCSYEMAWAGSPEIVDPDRLYGAEELLNLPLIGYEELSPPDIWMRKYFGDLKQKRGIQNTTNSMSTMIWLAEKGLGVAAIPPSAIQQHLADKRLVILQSKRNLEPVTFYMTHRTRPRSPVVDVTTKMVRNVVDEFY